MTVRSFSYGHVVVTKQSPPLLFHSAMAHNLEGHGQRFFALLSSVRAPSDVANGLHRPHPRKTGSDHQSPADAALVQRLRQGLRECDGQERAGRLTASLMGTWPVILRSRTQVEKVIHQVTLPQLWRQA